MRIRQFLSLVFLGFILFGCANKRHKESKFSYELIVLENNMWGYELFEEKKRIIIQKNIPAIQGNTPFSSKKDAEKVAELMIFKLDNRIFPPSISIAELDSMDIKY
jgi:hypothetical protein